MVDLDLFRHVVLRPESELDLVHAALVIAEPEYPGLDITAYVALVDRIGEAARRAVADLNEPPITPILAMLYERLGFRGNAENYYDPRNSFFNEVLERRTGIPITLAVLVMEVARRAGIAAQGVSFPGHFLVRSGNVVIDPFVGRRIGLADVRALYTRTTGDPGEPGPQLLEPCTKRELLQRMLGNLRGIYAQLGDARRLAGVDLRLDLLRRGEPSPRMPN